MDLYKESPESPLFKIFFDGPTIFPVQIPYIQQPSLEPSKRWVCV